MANFAALLKSEFTRLARKELKAQLQPLRKANAAQRHDIAALKRQLTDVQRQLAKTMKAAPVASPAAETGESPARFSAKGLQSHRARLGLSAGDYGALAGVSAQSIYNWERGKARPRASQAAALAELRGVGKRAALARLEGLQAE
jgi:DNA-binding transcriptional regulator YiaG